MTVRTFQSQALEQIPLTVAALHSLLLYDDVIAAVVLPLYSPALFLHSLLVDFPGVVADVVAVVVDASQSPAGACGFA